jgi:NAD(P)-dependent dehydrogenase (short-subunit alcohol dehydrogenase family)
MIHPLSLDGAVALVSGGGSGLGAATVDALRDRGAQVVILDLPGTSERLGTRSQTVVVEGDVRDEAAVAAAVETATGLGPLRVVVNCAGIGPPTRVLRRGEPHALDVFQRIVDINLVGTFNVLRLAATAIARNEPVDGQRGVIVNTASVAAFDGQIGQAAYAASKGGIAAMTLPVARDLASSLIRVVTIAPGLFDTPLLASLPQEARDSLSASVPNPSRLGDPDEYAQLVTQIVDNGMLNGEVIRLDGAIRMAPR